eukprot:PLAT4063.1.p1 GENE.PLAT4063.1~~PLAT4063.1.p1  ORF type:complete len:598 (-),score=113.97 PLAT4063.1:32-1792(-)
MACISALPWPLAREFLNPHHQLPPSEVMRALQEARSLDHRRSLSKAAATQRRVVAVQIIHLLDGAAMLAAADSVTVDESIGAVGRSSAELLVVMRDGAGKACLRGLVLMVGTDPVTHRSAPLHSDWQRRAGSTRASPMKEEVFRLLAFDEKAVARDAVLSVRMPLRRLDEDQQHHVNNTIYAVLLEALLLRLTRRLHSRRLSGGAAKLAKALATRGWRTFAIRYVHEVTFSDVLQVQIALTDDGNGCKVCMLRTPAASAASSAPTVACKAVLLLGEEAAARMPARMRRAAPVCDLRLRLRMSDFNRHRRLRLASLLTHFDELRSRWADSLTQPLRMTGNEMLIPSQQLQLLPGGLLVKEMRTSMSAFLSSTLQVVAVGRSSFELRLTAWLEVWLEPVASHRPAAPGCISRRPLARVYVSLVHFSPRHQRPVPLNAAGAAVIAAMPTVGRPLARKLCMSAFGGSWSAPRQAAALYRSVIPLRDTDGDLTHAGNAKLTALLVEEPLLRLHEDKSAMKGRMAALAARATQYPVVLTVQFAAMVTVDDCLTCAMWPMDDDAAQLRAVGYVGEKQVLRADVRYARAPRAKL